MSAVNGQRFGGVVAVFAIVFAAVLVGAPAESHAGAAAEATLSADLSAVDDAIARADVSAAARALHEAYQSALASRRWQGMLAYGDAALRVSTLTAVRQPAVEQARRAYLMALYRARGEASLDGTIAVARAFTALGDRDVARGALSMAGRLARTDGERARVHALTARLDDDLLASE